MKRQSQGINVPLSAAVVSKNDGIQAGPRYIIGTQVSVFGFGLPRREGERRRSGNHFPPRWPPGTTPQNTPRVCMAKAPLDQILTPPLQSGCPCLAVFETTRLVNSRAKPTQQKHLTPHPTTPRATQNPQPHRRTAYARTHALSVQTVQTKPED